MPTTSARSQSSYQMHIIKRLKTVNPSLEKSASEKKPSTGIVLLRGLGGSIAFVFLKKCMQNNISGIFSLPTILLLEAEQASRKLNA